MFKKGDLVKRASKAQDYLDDPTRLTPSKWAHYIIGSTNKGMGFVMATYDPEDPLCDWVKVLWLQEPNEIIMCRKMFIELVE